MGIDKGKTIRTFRLTLTCIFLFFITWYMKLPESAWALITIWFVMYEYSTVGGVINKSMLRFVGTTTSAVYGIIVIYVCGNEPLINMLALTAGLFVYSYWFMGNDKTYSGTIGAVTLTIVLLNYNNVDVALLRAINVIIGILFSIFMMRFFYPIYARDLLIETQVKWLNSINSLIQMYLDLNLSGEQLKISSDALENTILIDFSGYNKLLTEAKAELPDAPFFITHSSQMKEHLQKITRLLSMFIHLLSTNEMRTQPWSCNQLALFQIQLMMMKHKLLGEQHHSLESLSEQQEANTLETTKPNQLEEALFQELHKNMLLLEKDVEHVSLIHQYYTCCVQDTVQVRQS